jgi:hypothetical protein
MMLTVRTDRIIFILTYSDSPSTVDVTASTKRTTRVVGTKTNQQGQSSKGYFPGATMNISSYVLTTKFD